MTPDPAYDAAFKRYMEALLDGDARVGKKLIEELLGQQIALNRLYSDYIERGMYEIGRLWENNQISIADEHLAASTTQLLLADLYLKVNGREKNGKRVVIACVPHDLHELGSLIISSVFQLAGWDISLLGADVPTRALIDYVTPGAPTTYQLGYQNFFVITRYNRSSFYATAVYELAEAIKGQFLADKNQAINSRTPLQF